jgi:YesN/AraC family two-component response regulator
MENILIVDDEKNIVHILSELVKKWGYNPIQAGSGKEALEKFKDMPVDLVITDMVMPEMDGLSLINKITEIRPNTMILMLTGYPTFDSAVQSIKAGAFDFLAKPINSDELKHKIERCIERKDLLKSKSVMKGMNWALIISIPFWLILGIILAKLLR